MASGGTDAFQAFAKKTLDLELKAATARIENALRAEVKRLWGSSDESQNHGFNGEKSLGVDRQWTAAQSFAVQEYEPFNVAAGAPLMNASRGRDIPSIREEDSGCRLTSRMTSYTWHKIQTTEAERAIKLSTAGSKAKRSDRGDVRPIHVVPGPEAYTRLNSNPHVLATDAANDGQVVAKVDSEWPNDAEGLEPWRIEERVADSISNGLFDRVMGLFILLNAGLIGVETDYMARHWNSPSPQVFGILDTAFCVLFVAELAVRVVMYGNRFFSMAGWHWHAFDCCMVGLQVLEQVVKFSSGLPFISSDVLRSLRVLRLIRSLRIMRMLHLVKELNEIFIATVHAIRALLWTFLLSTLLMYIVGICLTQVVTDHKVSVDGLHGQQEVLDEYYGSLGLSMLSLYMMISQGIQWNEASSPVMKFMSPYFIVLFMFYITSTIFGLINIVTSVFVGSVVEAREENKKTSLMTQLRQVFSGSEQITLELFKQQLDDPQVQSYLQAVDISPADVDQLFSLVDVERIGAIPLEGFVHNCLRLNGSARAIDLAIFMDNFAETQSRIFKNQKVLIGNQEAILAQGMSKSERPQILESATERFG